MSRPCFAPSFNLEVILARCCPLLFIIVVHVSVEKYIALTVLADSHEFATTFVGIDELSIRKRN
jgi:hypothetical protein